MGLHFHYSHPTTPAGTGFDIDLGDAVQLGALSGLATQALAGGAAMSNVTIDDPDGTLDIKSLHRFYVVEDESPAGDTMLWNGYIGNQKVGRSTYGETYLHGAARGWELDLADDNAIFGFRIIWDTDGNRSAESSSARLTWLLGTANAYLEVYDEGLVNWAGMSTALMDACDYRGQFAGDVVEDIALHQSPPWNWWAQYEETSQHIQLWLDDSNASTAFASTISISNVEADCDYETVFPPGMDATLTRDSTKIAAGVYLPYSGPASAAVYVYDYDTSYAYGFRDQAAPSANVKTATNATSRANAFLADHDEPEEKLTCRIWLPADKVTSLKAGHLVDAKFSHFPGYEDYRSCRVTQRTVGQFERTLGVYEVSLELTPVGSAPVCGIYDSFTRTLPSTWGVSEGTDHGWVASATGGGSVSVDGGRGVLTHVSEHRASGEQHDPAFTTPLEVKFTYQLEGLPDEDANYAINVNCYPGGTGVNGESRLQIQVGDGTISMNRHDGSTYLSGTPVAASVFTTDVMAVHVYADLNVSRANVWPAAESEPGGWMVSESLTYPAGANNGWWAFTLNVYDLAFANTAYIDYLDVNGLPECRVW